MKRGECAIQQFGQQISFPKRALRSGWRGFTWQRWKKEKDEMSMQLNDRNQMAKIWNLVSLAGLLICVALAFWAYKNGILDSVDTLQAFIAKFG